MASEDSRVLSIQSHVVSGYCGNKAVVFPLQVLGFEVDFINSVQFCAHTWYKVCQGQVLDNKDLSVLYQGLKDNAINHYTHVTTGYVGSESFLNELCRIITDLKSTNPGIQYFCDPVMGDDGTMYVPESLIPLYREKVLPLADVLVPNQFEAEKLTGLSIKTEEEVLAALEHLHSKGPRTVVMTSTDLGHGGARVGYASTLVGEKRCRLKLTFPEIGGQFVGTGDLFSALFLAWNAAHPDDLRLVCEKVLWSMQRVLKRTNDFATRAAAAEGGDGGTPTFRQRELKLVQSKADLEAPEPVEGVLVTVI